MEVSPGVFLAGTGDRSKPGGRALELRAVTSLGKILVADGERKKALELMSGVVDLLEGPESAPSLPDIREALDLRKRLL